MRTPNLSNERGIALALAVFALVIIGALVAGIFFAGRMSQRDGSGSIYATQAFEAAEAGLADAVGNWDRSANKLATGSTVTLAATTSLGTGRSYSITASRLNDNLFLIRSEGRRTAGTQVLSRRLLATLARLDTPDMDIKSAITLKGSLTLGGSAEVSGQDHLGTGWSSSCPPLAADQPGIRGSDLSINTNGANCGGTPPACVSGDPPVQEDSSVTDSTFRQFGSTTFDELAAAADINISGTINGIGPDTLSVPSGSPTGTRGRCDYADSRNWGEPDGSTKFDQCFNYFPIIYASGNVRISGGRGQGILLVQGDLDMSGGVEFYGPVVVLGNLTSTGTGGHIYGGVMAENADLDPTVITGNSVVNYSACAVSRALSGAASVKPLAERSWAALY